ncbi:hypothetical protein, partial [Xanthomonas oryzae]|uniref:hypothetical protein n=1 Tax=Xanthomonas oryzae TaxID=347 RepID=UPI001C49CF15
MERLWRDHRCSGVSDKSQEHQAAEHCDHLHHQTLRFDPLLHKCHCLHGCRQTSIQALFAKVELDRIREGLN